MLYYYHIQNCSHTYICIGFTVYIWLEAYSEFNVSKMLYTSRVQELKMRLWLKNRNLSHVPIISLLRWFRHRIDPQIAKPPPSPMITESIMSIRSVIITQEEEIYIKEILGWAHHAIRNQRFMPILLMRKKILIHAHTPHAKKNSLKHFCTNAKVLYLVTLRPLDDPQHGL